MIHFACQECGRMVHTQDANAAGMGRCPQCGAVIEIPGEGASPQAGRVSTTTTPANESMEIVDLDERSRRLGDTDILPAIDRQNADRTGESETAAPRAQTESEWFARARALDKSSGPCTGAIIVMIAFGVLAAAAGTVLLLLLW